MSFLSWLRRSRRDHIAMPVRRGSKPRPRSSHLALEPLEDRCLLSAGQLDPTFGSGGKVITPLSIALTNDASGLVVSQPDNKVVVVGIDNLASGPFGLLVTRSNADGSPDGNFGSGGQVFIPFTPSLSLNPVAATSDAAGGILVAGTLDVAFGTPLAHTAFAVVRLTPNGALDTGFGSGGEATINFSGDLNATAGHVAVDSAGHIVVEGNDFKDVLPVTTGRDFAVARFNADGSPDTAFGSGGETTISFGSGFTSDFPVGLVIDASDRIVLAGTTSAGGIAVARLNAADGSLDSSFGSGGQSIIAFTSDFNLAPTAMTVDAAGRVILAGTTFTSATGLDFAVARLNAAVTSPDTTFGTGGQTSFGFGSGDTDDTPAQVLLDPAGRIAVVGSSTPHFFFGPVEDSFAAALLEPTGTLDVDFGVGGKVTTNFGDGFNAPVAAAAFDGAGRLVVAGTSSDETPGTFALAVVRYLGHDPVVAASSATFAGDLQTAVSALEAAPPVGTPRVVVQVDDASQLPAVLAAVAQLQVQAGSPEIQVLLETGPGTYSLGSVAVPAGLQLVIDGDGGAGGARNFTGSSAPALTVVAGDVLIQDGASFSATGSAPAIVVRGGDLTVRDSSIEGGPTGARAAVVIAGGQVDLGTADPFGDDPGGNTILVHGAGLLIRNTGPNDVSALGDTFLQDGVPFADNFRIEDAIDHSLDGLHGGTVFWVANNVFVSVTNGSVQRGVDVVPAGGIVNVETGVRGDFSVGTKLLTVAFADGSSMTQQLDDIDPTRRSLVVMGTFGDDTIRFEPGDGDEIRVEMNQNPAGTFRPNGRLIAIGEDGNDDIEVSDGIHLPAWLYGGEFGNNYLKGGGGNNVLIGGLGDDTLIGGGGRDLLIGDGGTDVLHGSGGDDILIGGFTQYDDAAFDPTSEAALAAIMAEWTSGHDYQTRLTNLVNGGGLNGTATLTPDATVFDDGNANVLDGGAGRDLFFAGLLDAIAHRRPNEAVYSL